MNPNTEQQNNNSPNGNFQIRKLPCKRIALIAAGFIGILFLLFLGIIWYLIASAPDINTISVSPTESATYICDEDGNYLRKLTLASSNRDIVTIEEIPETLQQAIISIEDERFYEHGGIDLRGIARAFWTGVTQGSFSEGASTITQQLIKNSVFTDWTLENSFADRFRRKVQEQYLALQLEKQMGKEEILEHYLNTINLGAGCYGVQAASHRYFGKDVSELSLSESAVLAAIPQNPSGYNPIRYPEANGKRAQIILDYMEDQNFISSEEKEDALADEVYTRIQAFDATYESDTAYTYYEDALIDQVTEALIQEKGCDSQQAYRAVFSGGLRIISAQDIQLQQICDEEFSNPLNFPAGTQFGMDYALSVADEYGRVTHYGTEALRTYIRQTLNPDFDLVCTTEEEAQQYTDAFREHILASYEADASPSVDASENSGQQAASDNTVEIPDTAPAENTDTAENSDINSVQSDSEKAGSLTNTEPAEYTLLGERLTLAPQPQASLVLIDQHTGLVRALVGGRGEKTASLTLNRATETTRQPGSTFKILTAYAPALDGFDQTLITEYENEPYNYEDGTPVSNWDVNDYSGAVTIREAITRSINVAAVRCLTEISPRTGFEYAQKFGISTLHETYESDGNISSDIVQPLALGGITQGVTNLELCNAYAAIADGGLVRTPKFFTKILDRHGNVVLDYTDETPSQVISENASFLLTSAMQDVVSDPSGTAYGSISAAGQPVAGKTGTTSNYKDIWFVGYTPYYTCSIWGGYDNNQNLPGDAHSYSKTLWSAVMNRIHSNLPAADFEQPDTIVSVTLCTKSHCLPMDDACPETYTEYFVKGTEPDTVCQLHKPIPETEPIQIYTDILNELLSETELSTESESQDGITALPGESETVPESGILPPGESETTPDSGTWPPGSSGTTPESGTLPPDNSETTRESGTLPPGNSNPSPDSGILSPEISDTAPDSGIPSPGTSGTNPESGTLNPDNSQASVSVPGSATISETSSLEDLINRLAGESSNYRLSFP